MTLASDAVSASVRKQKSSLLRVCVRRDPCLAATHTLSGRTGKVVASHAAVARSIPLRCTDLYYARGAQRVLPMRVGGATSQLDLPSRTPFTVAVVVDCN